MFWALLIFFFIGIAVGAVPAGFIYYEWRCNNRERAERLEAAVKRHSGRAARLVGRATVTAAKGTAAAASASGQVIAERAAAAAKAKTPLRWTPLDEPVRAEGFILQQTPTYVGNARYGRVDEPSAIDAGLPVRLETEAPPLPYWPSYAAMAPAQRGYYLRWLANGRRAIPAEIGYAFVFFYGLERRALVDQQDYPLVIAEVLRLRQLHQAGPGRFSGSFEQYSSGFLWFLTVAAPEAWDAPQVRELAEATRYWNEERLASMLAWLSSRRLPLPRWAALILAEQLPQSQRSVVTKRVGDERHQLNSVVAISPRRTSR